MTSRAWLRMSSSDSHVACLRRDVGCKQQLCCHRYGTDKPDLRFGFEMADISACVAHCDFKTFANTVTDGGVVKALRIPDV